MGKRIALSSIVCFFVFAALVACSGAKKSFADGENGWLNSKINYGSVKDSRDGQVYKTVTIGSQTWMAENLNYKTDESYCHGDDCLKFGRLYSWKSAMDACPDGWNLPTDGDWIALLNKVGGQAAGGKLLKATKDWLNLGNGTDDFGFSAIPAGVRFDNGKYSADGAYAFFWSSTENRAENAYSMNLSYFNDRSDLNEADKKNGFSVRCIRENLRREGDAVIPDSIANFITDSRDGQTYRTVKIGSQIWMAQNLNYKTEKSSCYDDADSNCTKYGRLYTWADAMDSTAFFSTNGKGCGYTLEDRDMCTPRYPVRGICPLGYHIPTPEEWYELFVVAGDEPEKNDHYTMAGKRLKSKTGWPISNEKKTSDFISLGAGYFDVKDYAVPISVMGTDDYGFSVLPSGFKEGYRGGYKEGGSRAKFWTSVQINSSFVKDVFFLDDETTAFNSSARIEHSLSVRCVKD